MPPDQPVSVDPLEFCRLERALIEGMAMRKKRNVQMRPIQDLKLRLLAHIEERSPQVEELPWVLAEAVYVVSPEGAIGPAQAVASDLQMDWEMACSSPSFMEWLRGAASAASEAGGSPQPDSNR
ncbi:MAG: hypothetical protein Q8R28_04490 [Dehalococcoidia bacterium]|nr:hypothetical protein [Dehalococcoidia bacterium]